MFLVTTYYFLTKEIWFVFLRLEANTLFPGVLIFGVFLLLYIQPWGFHTLNFQLSVDYVVGILFQKTTFLLSLLTL